MQLKRMGRKQMSTVLLCKENNNKTFEYIINSNKHFLDINRQHTKMGTEYIQILA